MIIHIYISNGVCRVLESHSSYICWLLSIFSYLSNIRFRLFFFWAVLRWEAVLFATIETGKRHCGYSLETILFIVNFQEFWFHKWNSWGCTLNPVHPKTDHSIYSEPNPEKSFKIRIKTKIKKMGRNIGEIDKGNSNFVALFLIGWLSYFCPSQEKSVSLKKVGSYFSVYGR